MRIYFIRAAFNKGVLQTKGRSDLLNLLGQHLTREFYKDCCYSQQCKSLMTCRVKKGGQHLTRELYKPRVRVICSISHDFVGSKREVIGKSICGFFLLGQHLTREFYKARVEVICSISSLCSP
jgi:hypothetical protein